MTMTFIIDNWEWIAGITYGLANVLVAVVPKWRNRPASVDTLLGILQKVVALQPPDAAGTLKLPLASPGPLAGSPNKTP